jgi:hypothetical protein
MRLRGPGAAAAAVAVAAVIAAVGVAANLHLLEPHGGSGGAVVLGVAIDPSSTTTTIASPPTTPAPTTTTTATTGEPPLRRSYAVGEAGTVTLLLRSGALAVESVVPGAGWRYEIEDQRTDRVEIAFRSGEDEQASFHASVQGGEVRVEIEPEEGESPDD